MRILNVTHQYLPEFIGGTELYTQAISRALRAHGHDVGIFYRSYRPRSDQSIVVKDAPEGTLLEAGTGPATPAQRFLSSYADRSLNRQWRDALDHFQPEVVHVQHLMGLPMQTLDLLAERRIPCLITLLDYWWVCANANLLTNDRGLACNGPHLYLNCARCAVARSGQPATWVAAPAAVAGLAWRAARLRRLLARADALLAPSSFVHDWYAAHGAPAARLHTVRWGIMPPAEGIPARRPPDDTLRLLYVGGLAPNKGVHVVLEALRGVQGRVQMTVAGDASKHPDYVATLRALAGPNVTFTGPLARPQVWQAMAEADVVVVPSLWHETFCLVAHEAVATGAVVFASDMGALREIVQHERSGALLAPGDVAAWRRAVQRAVDDRALLEQWRAALPRVRRFDEHAAEVEALYDSVASSGNDRSA